MNRKNKKALFICQLYPLESRQGMTQTLQSEKEIPGYLLKVVRCAKKEFTGGAFEAIPSGRDEKITAQSIKEVLDLLGYNRNPLIIALPRQSVTLRYLKVPAQTHDEIEQIVSLQAPKYLPYPSHELVSSYQIISTEKDGFSSLTLNIAPQDAVDRLTRLFQGLNARSVIITPGTYGLVQLSASLNPQLIRPVMVIEIDAAGAEIAIIAGKRLLLSRTAAINFQDALWVDTLVEELNKTTEMYGKEIAGELPAEILVFGPLRITLKLETDFQQQVSLPLKVITYWERISVSGQFKELIEKADYSAASLIGLGLEDVGSHQHLVSVRAKVLLRKNVRLRKRAKSAVLIILIAGLAVLGAVKHTNNKARYLRQLQTQLRKVEEDANPLEMLYKKIEFLESRSGRNDYVLDFIHELYRLIPDGISLAALSYEDQKFISFRGQAPEMRVIFECVTRLESSEVFRRFNVKVKYATKRKTQAGDNINFEITCSQRQ